MTSLAETIWAKREEARALRFVRAEQELRRAVMRGGMGPLHYVIGLIVVRVVLALAPAEVSDECL
jgi:hypothetical protein